jgi:hypothetical protein
MRLSILGTNLEKLIEAVVREGLDVRVRVDSYQETRPMKERYYMVDVIDVDEEEDALCSMYESIREEALESCGCAKSKG